jgi:hypothetical protein
MQARAHILFPFDLGLELDFSGKDAQEIFKQVSSRKTAVLSFEDLQHLQATVLTQIYKFGVGSIEISFDLDVELEEMARLSCFAENIMIGKMPILRYCQSHVDGVIQQASAYADYRYEQRLEETDLFPVFVLGESLHGEADQAEPIRVSDTFVRRHRKVLYGIVAGEPRYDELSDFVLERANLPNYGYYEDELILLERFGAVLYSRESATILNLLKIAYSQYWSLKSYNFILDKELDNAQHVLENVPPYYKFWLIPGQYQRFSKEAMDFGRDKLAIVESLYSAGPNIPRIDADWHLRTLFSSIRKVFTIEDLYKTVDVKLVRIEEAYNSAREFLSTNFFILLDIIFFTSLAWSIIDTFLLWKLSHP